jgi:hypothetical protein
MSVTVKARFYILFPLLYLFTITGFSQTVPFRENAKWGIKENEKMIINPVYDTIFNFDSTNKICLACYRTKSASANKFIKVFTTTYSCNYLNKKNERLMIRNMHNDTISVFALTKNSQKQYWGNSPFFVVSTKNKKFLLNKNFDQLTYKGYHDISLSPDPSFYFTHVMSENDVVLAGLVNTKEEEIIPYQYSIIKINTDDSLIIACSAGVRVNAEDEIFNYQGKKVIGVRRHIDMATKNFLIHKIFEPKEYYILYNINTKEEKSLNADEVQFYRHDEILIRSKNDWYIYDMNTNQKKPIKQS